MNTKVIKYVFIVGIVICVLLAVKGEKEEKSTTAVTEDNLEVNNEGIGQIADEEAQKSDGEKEKDGTDTEEMPSQEETMPQESAETDPFARYETGTAEQEKLWSFTGTCEYGDYVKLKRYQNQFDNSNVKTKELLVTDILDGGEMIEACEYTTDYHGDYNPDTTPNYDAIYAITDLRENKDITILEGDKIKIYGTLYKSSDTYVHIDAKYIRNAAIDGNIQFERTTIPDAAYEAYVSNPEGLDLYDSAYLTKNVVNHLDFNAPVLICESENDDRASIYQYGHLIGFSPMGYIRYYNFIPASEVPEADVTESIDPSTIAGTYSYEFGENEDACGAELTITGDDINNLSIEGNCWYGESCGEFYAKIGLSCHDRVVEFKDDNGCILEVYQTKSGGIYVTQIGEAGGYGATFYGEYQRGE